MVHGPVAAAVGLTIASVLWRLPQIERLEAPAGAEDAEADTAEEAEEKEESPTATHPDAPIVHEPDA